MFLHLHMVLAMKSFTMEIGFENQELLYVAAMMDLGLLFLN